MSQPVKRLAAAGPGLVVSLTAVFALPHTAGPFRLAKWGAFGLGLAALALAMLVRRRLPRPAGLLPVALVAFVACAIALPVLSPARSATHLPEALLWLSGLALFLLTAAATGDHDEARRACLTAVVAAGAIGAAVVLAQAAGLRWLTSDVYTGSEFRAPGTSGNPNWAAAFLAPLVPVCLGLAATAPRRRIFHACAALLAVATVATLSKAGVLALGAGLVVLVLLDQAVPRRRRAALLGATLAAGAFASVIAWRLGWLSTLPWMRGRIFLWRAALWLTAEHPLTGVGLGGYLPSYGRAAEALVAGDPAAFLPLSSVDFAHHDLLQLAAEGGVVTAAALVLVIAAVLALAWRRQDPLARAAGAAIAALAVDGVADAPLRVPTTFALFFLLLGLLAQVAPRARLPRGLVVAVALLGSLQGVRFLAGNQHWTLGREALRRGRPAAAELARARTYLPEHGPTASQLARALARGGEIDAALEASRVAAGLRFDLDDEIFRRDLLARSMEPEDAIRMWRELARSYPVLVTPQLRLGALHLRAGDRAAAIVAYESVLANPQPTPRARAARAHAASLLRSLQGGGSPATDP